MKIYILTHFSEIDPHAFSSQLDIQGLENADKIIGHLKDRKIDKIYCSPYLKTIQTIYPFCNKYNKQMNIEPAFHDAMFKSIDANVDIHICRNYANHFGYSYISDCINYHYKPKLFSSNISLRENDMIVKNRIFSFLHNICHRYKKKDKNILIVTHKIITNFIIKFFDLSANCSSLVNEQITEINIPDTWDGIRLVKS